MTYPQRCTYLLAYISRAKNEMIYNWVGIGSKLQPYIYVQITMTRREIVKCGIFVTIEKSQWDMRLPCFLIFMGKF